MECQSNTIKRRKKLDVTSCAIRYQFIYRFWASPNRFWAKRSDLISLDLNGPKIIYLTLYIYRLNGPILRVETHLTALMFFPFFFRKYDVDFFGQSTKGDLNVKLEHLEAFVIFFFDSLLNSW